MSDQTRTADTVLARLAEAEARATTMDVVDMAELVDRAGAVGWLAKPLWPADAYGVIAAEDKAGKTWIATDLAVSVATGTPWLGHFECEAGPVVMYCGEGGARNIVRRVKAIAEHKGVKFGVLRNRLYVSETAPRLKDVKALETMSVEVRLHGPRLVLIDPLYLAAVGGRGADLYAMGEVLSGAQYVCQENGAALVVTHHWNKTGTGTGVQRMTGVGPTAWGRVLGSGSVSSVQTDPATGRTHAVLEWEFLGSEIAGTSFTVERDVWAEDPNDLGSPLHYESSVTTGLTQMVIQAQAQAVRDAAEDKRVLDWLRANPSSTGSQVEAGVGVMGRRHLKDMEKRNLVTWVSGPRRARLWSAV